MMKSCDCDSTCSIEPHGLNYALYFNRCNHQHGYRLATLSDISYNCELGLITKLLNATEPDSLKCDKLARVEREIKITLSQEHGVVGTASFHRTQAYEHVLQIIINLENAQ